MSRFTESVVEDATRLWLEKFAGVTEEAICAIVDDVPSERMSPIAKEFTTQLILINQNRLLQK